MNLWVTRRISNPSHQNPLTPYRMPFPSLHHNDASHQASLLTSPCGFNLKAHKHAANSLKRREICQMLEQDCVNFLGRLCLFYSSFIMFEFFFVAVVVLYVCLEFKLTWTEEVNSFGFQHTTLLAEKEIRNRCERGPNRPIVFVSPADYLKRPNHLQA